MADSLIHNSEELKAWSYLITKGITNAITNFVPTQGQGITVDSIKIGRVAAKDMPGLLGGSESLAIGIYSTLSGTVNGHIMISHRPELAFRLLNIHPDTSTNLSEREQCALSEMETGMRNAFLSAVEDAFEIPLHPSPPIVLLDKTNAILNVAQTGFSHGDDTSFVVDAMLTINQQLVQGIFVIMLDRNFIQVARNLTVKV